MALVVFCFLMLYRKNESHRGDSKALSQSSGATSDQTEGISTLLIEQLSSKDEDTRTAAKNELIRLARQSEASRKALIETLISRVQRPDFRVHLTTLDESYFFESTSELFVDLQAEEAVDFLADCIDCPAITGITSESYHHRPAVRALIGLGDLAVPRLAKLLYHPDAQIRSYAAFCLGNITTKSSRDVLSQAIAVQSDPYWRRQIQYSIDTIDRVEGLEPLRHPQRRRSQRSTTPSHRV
jgi:HEAT repeat protein